MLTYQSLIIEQGKGDVYCRVARDGVEVFGKSLVDDELEDWSNAKIDRLIYSQIFEDMAKHDTDSIRIQPPVRLKSEDLSHNDYVKVADIPFDDNKHIYVATVLIYKNTRYVAHINAIYWNIGLQESGALDFIALRRKDYPELPTHQYMPIRMEDYDWNPDWNFNVGSVL